ncbi:MAG: adenylate/guanylate cyclase domain-containing protein [Acidobacteriota bacterium]
MAKLVITDVSGNSFEFKITKPETRIGRNPKKNDLVLPAKQVSNTHALFKRIGNEYLLLDLNSTNGTYVKDERVVEKRIKDGDLFSVGPFALKLVDHKTRNSVSYSESPISSTVLLRSASFFTGLYETRNLDQDLERVDLEARLQEKVKILETLYALGRTLSSVFDTDKIFEQIVELLFKLTPADRCAILFNEPTVNSLELYLIKVRPERQSANRTRNLAISRTITAKVMEERLSLLSVDAQDDRRLTSDSITIQHIHSVMCAPMLGKNGVLGVIYVDKVDLRDSFSSDDLDLLNAVASQAAIAVDNARAYEQLAREAVARASYQRFMPNHVIDIILQSPQELKLGGVTQPVTILFADIRGFTAMAENSPPEVVVDVLNRFFSAMTEIIFANYGTLDKYLGDGLMAIFGAPYRSDDDAINAVNAAIAMQRRMIKLNAEMQKLGFRPIDVGIGINTGEVTVGCIGSERRMDYTAIGNPVNLAARLMQRAKGQEILISEMTKELLGEVFRTSPIGDLSFKGMSSVTRVYQVLYK